MLVSDWLHIVALVPLTLLPIINPLSAAPVFSMTVGTDAVAAQLLARQVAINCLVVLATAILIGTYVLDVFGISLPIVRVAGGLLVAASGWRMLNRSDDDEVTAAVRRQQQSQSPIELARRSFFPITFPLTTGPGTIAASIAIGAGLPRKPALYLAGAAAALIGSVIVVAIIYLIYRHAASLLARMGEVGNLVLTRLMAFVLLCVGLQIIWTGWAELNGIVPRA